MRSEPRSVRPPRSGRRCQPGQGLACALVLLAALALGACGAVGGSTSDPTPLGSGTGGPAVSGATTAASIPDMVGGTQGQFSYDPSYFVYVPQTPTASDNSAGQLVSVGQDVGLQFSVIFGRPDTPCRYQAALAARDDGFSIQGNGEDRVNDHQVEFHEVLLHSTTQYWRLDCAQLKGNVGVQVLGVTQPNDERGIAQVLYVLNSIHP